MGLSWWHILIVMLVLLVLFGRGRISGLMSELGAGIRSLKNILSEANPDREHLEGRGPAVSDHTLAGNKKARRNRKS